MREELKDHRERGECLSDTPYRIGVLLGGRSNPFWTEMKKQYELFAPDLGMAVEHFWAAIENDRNSQLDMLRAMLTRSFDAIIINPVSNMNLVPAILEAVNKGIPILDVGAKTDQEAVKAALPMYAPVRTVDFFEQGVMGGTYISERLCAAGGGKVAIIEGRTDSAQSIGRSNGAAEAFLSAAPKVRLVARKSAGFDRSLAKSVARTLIADEPGIAAFFCANAVMALGVAEVLEKSHVSGKIIVGVDFTEEVREAIKKGRFTGTVAFSPASVARVVLDAADRIRRGQKVPEGFTVASTLVTGKNVDAYAG